MSDHRPVHHTDPARTVELPGSVWRATVAVGPDGSETLWLLSPEPDPMTGAGCACRACAPHEQLGTTVTLTPTKEQTT